MAQEPGIKIINGLEYAFYERYPTKKEADAKALWLNQRFYSRPDAALVRKSGYGSGYSVWIVNR